MADTNLSSFIWSVADLLRGDYKRSDFGKVILPFTVLRRLDCVLEGSKAEVLAFARKTYGQKLDSSLSKAEVLAAAKALERGPEPETGPGSVIALDGSQAGLGQDQDSQPGWLLGDDQDAEEPEAVPGVPTDLLI